MPEHSDSRFFVDQSLMGLGKALAIARKGEVAHPGYPLIPEVKPGALDIEWMPPVGARGLVVIGADGKIRFRDQERSVWRSSGLRMIRLGGRKNLTTWGYLTLLVSQWDNIEDLVKNRPVGPWFFRILTSGEFREMHVPE